MINNDILRRLRYILNITDTKIIKILSLVNHKAPLPRITSWLKKEEQEGFTECNDNDLTAFLDGLIIEKRGKREDSNASKIQTPQRLNNNLVFLKLKIAFNLKSDDVLAVLKMAQYSISSSELSAFFRKKTHRHYRVCKDQILRKFLKGLQLKFSIPQGSHPKSITKPKAPQKAKLVMKKSTKFNW